MFVSMITEGIVRIGISIVVLLVILIILLKFREKSNPAKSSLELLKDRLEKGEITKEEYEAARKKQIKD